MKKILILTYKKMNNGPRFIREIEALKHHYKIVAFGRTPPPFDFVEFVPNHFPSLFERALGRIYRIINNGKPFDGRFPGQKKTIDRLIDKHRPDIIITHDPQLLPYIYKNKNDGNFKVVFNAHEYHPLEFESSKNWLRTEGAYFNKLYKTYLNQLDLLVNVCEGIAMKCKEEFGKNSLVIPNACFFYKNLSPVLHDENEKVIKMIHHGAAIRERKIELMIEAVKKLGDGFRLDLMLMPWDKIYMDELKSIANNAANIHIIPTVNFSEIVPFLNKYDIGLFNLPPTNFNNLHSLPNKFFEFIQARLCVVIGNSPEMKKIVKKYNLGLVSPGFSAGELYDCLKNINMTQINEYKLNADNAAEKVSAEKYYQSYLDALELM